MNKIKISAVTKEEWDKIKEKLDLLPQSVIDQIETADVSFAINCHLKSVFSDNPRIFIPKELVTKITEIGGLICIYCGDYFLRAPKENFPYEYVFVDMPDKS